MGRNMNQKKQVLKTLFIFFLMLFPGLLSAGIMEKPRRVYITTTEHFDILFSSPSSNTAKLIAENAESFYETAATNFNYNFPLKLLIIISPDSDKLSAKYTVLPYNRIVIYDSVPTDSQKESYNDTLLDLFRHEIESAISRNVTDKFWYSLRKYLVGPTLQPEALINMPYSFLEGALSAEDDKFGTGKLNDNWKLQLLTQAKIQGQFPSLVQVLGTKDTKPGKEFCTIAAGAFCAYIQQKWGLAKFAEYWEKGGKLNFFFLHKGIFQTVYETPLEEAWNEFVDSIPLPVLAEDNSDIFIKNTSYSSYEFILHSPYGYIWYDSLKNEVDIYDDNVGFQQFKRLLFMASDLNDLTLSPDGRYLVISNTQKGSRTDFDVDIARIYDLKTREFTGDKFYLRHASLIELENGKLAIAGINVKSKEPEIQVIPAAKTNKRLGFAKEKNPDAVFNRKFALDSIPSTPVYAGLNQIATIINSNSTKYLALINIKTGEERYYNLNFQDETLNIQNLRYNNISFLELSKTSADFVLMFDYISKLEGSLSRCGMIFFTKEMEIQQIIVQDNDISGGINKSVFFGQNFYYSSHKHDHDELRKLSVTEMSFQNAEFTQIQTDLKNGDELIELAEYPFDYKTFIPIRYMLKGTWMPFMPVKSVSFSEGIEQWPGLGLAFTTGADPFGNNQLTLSAGFGFLPMDFSMIFNATEEERKALKFEELTFFDDFTFAAYYKNSATFADILGSTLMTFNKAGEYKWDVIGGMEWEVPLMMTFRRFTFDAEAKFTAETTYWDPNQSATFPDLHDWPSLADSYKSFSMIGITEYSNVHQYGLSPYSKMGITAGISVNANWDINLIALQEEKRKNGEIESVKPENLTQAIENQLWGNPYAPTQINLGLYGTAEIPQLIPIQNKNDWIINVPASLYGELFYTNGTALDINFKFLVLGKEIQNGFNAVNLYFPRMALYFGYDVQRLYDTNKTVLPDIRDFTRFYEAFANTYFNDSIYTTLNLYVTPIIGKFSSFQLITDLKLEYFIQTGVWKLDFKLKAEF